MACRSLRAVSRVPWRNSLKKIVDFNVPFYIYIFFLSVCCQKSCINLGQWPVVLRVWAHIMKITPSAYFKPAYSSLFWRIIHPVLLESINWNYNNAKWPSVFCFLWSFIYIKHMWLWLANSTCDLLPYSPLKKKKKGGGGVKPGSPKTTLVKPFEMAGQWVVTCRYCPLAHLCWWSQMFSVSRLCSLLDSLHLPLSYNPQTVSSVCSSVSLEKHQVPLPSIHHLKEEFFDSLSDML